jgi:hypothetical protein
VAGRRGYYANPDSALLERLIQALMEPIGREARRRAAAIISASLDKHGSDPKT